MREKGGRNGISEGGKKGECGVKERVKQRRT